MIKLVAVFITFALSTIYFSTDRLTPLPKSAIQSEIRGDKFRVREISARKPCNLSLKHGEAAILACRSKILEYESDHTGSIDLSAHTNLKPHEKMSLIISDHKTHCEYIDLFGKQIGDIPRA